jgi:hypothetical protein
MADNTDFYKKIEYLFFCKGRKVKRKMFAQKVFAPIATGFMQHMKEKIYERESMHPMKMLTKECPADLAMRVQTPIRSHPHDHYFMHITTTGFCMV